MKVCSLSDTQIKYHALFDTEEISFKEYIPKRNVISSEDTCFNLRTTLAHSHDEFTQVCS